MPEFCDKVGITKSYAWENVYAACEQGRIKQVLLITAWKFSQKG